jgi:hypothetical protein
VELTKKDFLIYTRGFVPFLRTYPGMRIPQPLELMEHYGDSTPQTLFKEILALTKMNWNSADFCMREPITLAFARRVGLILGEMPDKVTPKPQYKYYM